MKRPIDYLTYEDIKSLEGDVKEIVDKVCAAVDGKPTAAAYSAIVCIHYALERQFEYARSKGDIFTPLARDDMAAAARDVASDVVAASKGTQS